MKAYTRVARLALLLAASASTSASYAQTAFNLVPGWNLLGNSSASAIDVATVFGDPAKFSTVWKWDRGASKWAFYAPSLAPSALTTYAQGKGYDVLTSIDPKEGFWVNASSAVALSGPGAGAVTLLESDLQQGWNLMASADGKTPSQLNQALSSSLNAAGKAIATTWAWDASKAAWKFFAPTLEAQGGTVLADYIASKGYLPFSSALSAAEGFWLNIASTTTTAQATTTTAATSTTTSSSATTTSTTSTTLPRAGSATNFTAAAMAGEMLVYTLDTANLTYSYTITDSQYGLTGKTGAGTLTDNGDGTYMPSGVTNGIVSTLPNGLLLTSIYETLNGVPKTIPVMGMANPVTALSNSIFNYIERVCFPYYGCESDYGTFRITATGTWISCPRGNLAVGCSTDSYSGTLVSLGAGMWKVLDATGFNIGTAIVLSSGGQQVVFLDLKDPYFFGVGLLVGSTQQTATSAQADGTWVSSSSEGTSAQFLVSGNVYTCQFIYGASCSGAASLTFNYPWTGFATTSEGGTALLAGTGVYAYQASGGYVEIGIKMR